MICDLMQNKEVSAGVNVTYITLDQHKGELQKAIPSAILRLSSYARPLRVERAKKLRQPIDRLASLAAGALLDLAMAPNPDYRSLPIIEGSHGKPDFPKGSGLYFSLSHSRKAACCAISRSPVGVDVEGLVDSYESLCATCLTSDEKMYVKNCSNQAEGMRRFTQLWTRKEALGKYIGCGMEESVLHTNVLHWPSDEIGSSLAWNKKDGNKSVPQIESFNLYEACISVCGHGRVHISGQTLEEILASYTLLSTKHRDKEGRIYE